MKKLSKLCEIMVVGVIRMSIKTYSELSRLPSFEERYEYLRLHGTVGRETFGFDRYLNQILYRSQKWKRSRDKVIIRDNGCDLGIPDREIYGRIYIHHMNPIRLEDIFKICRFLDGNFADLIKIEREGPTIVLVEGEKVIPPEEDDAPLDEKLELPYWD